MSMAAERHGDNASLSSDDTVDTLRANQELRAEAQRLRRENNDLADKLKEACIDSALQRESRRAALNLMEERKITSLVVVEKDSQLLGVVHLHDLWGTESI